MCASVLGWLLSEAPFSFCPCILDSRPEQHPLCDLGWFWALGLKPLETSPMPRHQYSARLKDCSGRLTWGQDRVCSRGSQDPGLN